MHFNDHYAERSTFEKPLVHSGLSLAMVLGQTVTDTGQNAIANLGFDNKRQVVARHRSVDRLAVPANGVTSRNSRTSPGYLARCPTGPGFDADGGA